VACGAVTDEHDCRNAKERRIPLYKSSRLLGLTAPQSTRPRMTGVCELAATVLEAGADPSSRFICRCCDQLHRFVTEK
jgi:hypothetical protein